MGLFGWSYPPGAANDPSAPYNQDDEPIDLVDDKTLKGYGRRQHGLNGKDADLAKCGQNWIKTAWLFEDNIAIEGELYATLGLIEGSTKEEKDMQYEFVCGAFPHWGGEWTGDEWVLNHSYAIKIPFTWDDAKTGEENTDAACAAANDAIEKYVKPYEVELGYVHDGFDDIYKAVERRQKARDRRANKKKPLH